VATPARRGGSARADERRSTIDDDRDRRAMKRLFGAKKPRAPARTLEDTARTLDERAKTIEAKIAALDRELVKHREQIKRARPGAGQDAAKRRALVVLKQKKIYEQQRDQLGGQLMNVEQVAFASENAANTVETVRAMQSASKALKTQFKAKEFDLNAIDALNDDMADLLDLGEEIQETLGRSYHVPDGLDEDDLLEELDALELDMLEDESELTDGVPSYLQDEPLPEAPEEEPVVLPAAGAGEAAAPDAVRDAA
jgi:charged multivesicular body protein 5